MQSEERPMFDPLCKLRPGLARPPAPTAGAFFFREFVASADSFLLPQLRRRSHRCQASRIGIGDGSDEQMFRAEQQIPHGTRSD
jgi:hypothetical protein